MIAHVLRLTLWEWHKLRRRWMPWILLGVAILIAQIGLWFGYAAYHNDTLQEFGSGGSSSLGTTMDVDGKEVSVEVTCVNLVNGEMPPELENLPEADRRMFLDDLEQFRVESCGNTIAREGWREGFVIPSSISGSINGLQGIAVVLVMILAASTIGAEYGWGTLRTALTRGAGRWQLLASKLVLLMLVSAAGFIVVSIAAGAASIAAAVIPPDEAGGFADSGKWSDAAVTFGKAIYAMAPYAVLGAFLAVLTQSAAMGISIALGYYIVELIASPVLQLTSWGEHISDFILGKNVNDWMQSALVTIEVSGDGPLADQPEALQAFLVILAYAVALSAAAFWLFLRRDIAGARGS